MRTKSEQERWDEQIAASDLTPSQRALRGVITRVGSLSPEQQERVFAAGEDLDDGNGLTAQKWHQVINESGSSR